MSGGPPPETAHHTAPSLQIGTLTGFPSSAVMSLSFLQAQSCYWVSLQYSCHQVLLSIVTRFPFSSVMSMGFPFSAVMSMGFPFSTAMSLGSLQNWHVTVSNQYCHVTGFPFITVSLQCCHDSGFHVVLSCHWFPSIFAVIGFPSSTVMSLSFFPSLLSCLLVSLHCCLVLAFPSQLPCPRFPSLLSCHGIILCSVMSWFPGALGFPSSPSHH